MSAARDTRMPGFSDILIFAHVAPCGLVWACHRGAAEALIAAGCRDGRYGDGPPGPGFGDASGRGRQRVPYDGGMGATWRSEVSAHSDRAARDVSGRGVQGCRVFARHLLPGRSVWAPRRFPRALSGAAICGWYGVRRRKAPCRCLHESPGYAPGFSFSAQRAASPLRRRDACSSRPHLFGDLSLDRLRGSNRLLGYRFYVCPQQALASFCDQSRENLCGHQLEKFGTLHEMLLRL